LLCGLLGFGEEIEARIERDAAAAAERPLVELDVGSLGVFGVNGGEVQAEN
jgi:hypothetical protein